MQEDKKIGRYQRIFKQLENLLGKTDDPLARMASICAVLHHKMDHFFWTGFYFFKNNKLIVGPYQGPVACQELEKDKGVCWATVNQDRAIIVPDVELFPGHIACDSRSQSEITLPLKDREGRLIAVFDVDSDRKESFSEVDREQLLAILGLVYA